MMALHMSTNVRLYYETSGTCFPLRQNSSTALVDFSDQITKIYHQGASMAQLTFEHRTAEITKIYQRLSCRQDYFQTVGFAEFRRRSVKLTFEQQMLQITKIEQSLQPNLGHSNLPLPLESIGVLPAATGRFVRRIWHFMHSAGKCRGVTDGMVFGSESVSYGCGMANTPQQPAPDVATTPLRGRSYGTVPGQFMVDPRTSHE